MSSSSSFYHHNRILDKIRKNDSVVTQVNFVSQRLDTNFSVALGESLRGNTSVVILRLDCNLIGPMGALAIGKAMGGCCDDGGDDGCHFHNNGNGDYDAGDDENENDSNSDDSRLDTSSSRPCGGGCPPLVELNISNCDIGIQGALAIANHGLRSAKCLKRLDISMNGISTQGASALACAIQSNPYLSLETLDISNNGIGPDGATALVKNDAKSSLLSTLRELDISSNGIGPMGAASIANALHAITSTPLTKLVVFGNDIGPTGAAALAKSLRENQTPLTHLDISNNHIGNEGATALAHNLLRRNTTLLQNLDVSNNYISDTGMIAIAVALRQNQTLTNLNVMFNDTCRLIAFLELSNTLKTNTTLLSIQLPSCPTTHCYNNHGPKIYSYNNNNKESNGVATRKCIKRIRIYQKLNVAGRHRLLQDDDSSVMGTSSSGSILVPHEFINMVIQFRYDLDCLYSLVLYNPSRWLLSSMVANGHSNNSASTSISISSSSSRSSSMEKEEEKEIL